MTIEQVNEIFKTKYPDGEIYQRNSSRVSVIFKRNGERTRVYDYQYTSYVDLLNRLGFSIQYKRDKDNIISSINKLQKELDDGYEESLFLGKVNLSDAEKERRKERIKYLQEILDTAIFVNG